MIIKMLHINGTPVTVDSTQFPLVTCQCDRCHKYLIVDERGPSATEFAARQIRAVEDHRCGGLN